MSVQAATLNMLEAVNAIVTKARKLHDGIPETVVVLGASGATRSGQKHGHYAPRSWGSRRPSVSVDGQDGQDGGDGGAEVQREVYGEIFLAGESLERGAVGTLGTILHELVHAYCDANDIKDTSNGHRYHNTKFKEKAEEFGLEIEKAETIGWSVTTVPQSTIDTYRQEVEDLEARINVHRLGFLDLEALGLKEKEKSNPLKRKMQCYDCGEPLTVTLKWWELVGHTLYCTEHEQHYEMYEEN